MYIYAEVDPGYSETGSVFKGRVWGAAPADIGVCIIKTQKSHILQNNACA